MAYRDQYDYGDMDQERRKRRGNPEDEGFFDRVRDWFRDRVDEMDRNRGQNRDYQSSRYRSGPVRVYETGNDRNYDQAYPRRRQEYNRGSGGSGGSAGSRSSRGARSYRSGNRDYERDYGYNRDDSQRNPAWGRTRQWRSEDRWDQGNQPNRYSDRYTDYRGSDQDYELGMGRDLDEDVDYEYGLGHNPYQDWENRQRRGQGDNRSRRSSRYSDRGYNRGDVYPTAGMGADFRPNVDYDERDIYEEDVNFGEGDVGYESEGAFYQDLDEPVNYETQVYRYGRPEGPFVGMGPQDYQRSDERITEDVCERLTRHGRIDARDIRIDVHNGEVILQGSVPDREMKRMAEDVAENVSGVNDVHNEIKVNRSQSQGNRGWENRAETSPAGQTNAGAGLTTEGATSLQGMEAADQSNENRQDIREGMEVIGSGGKVVGRVKEIRSIDFLVDREMARDVYVPFSAVDTVGQQVMLNVTAAEVDLQGWEKPAIV